MIITATALATVVSALGVDSSRGDSNSAAARATDNRRRVIAGTPSRTLAHQLFMKFHQAIQPDKGIFRKLSVPTEALSEAYRRMYEGGLVVDTAGLGSFTIVEFIDSSFLAGSPDILSHTTIDRTPRPHGSTTATNLHATDSTGKVIMGRASPFLILSPPHGTSLRSWIEAFDRYHAWRRDHPNRVRDLIAAGHGKNFVEVVWYLMTDLGTTLEQAEARIIRYLTDGTPLGESLKP